MKLKHFLLLFALLLPFSIVSQNSNFLSTLREADSMFAKGEYDKAQELYTSLTAEAEGGDILNKIRNCVLIKQLLDSARSAERDGNDNLAKIKYEEILKLNPSDPNVKKDLAECTLRVYKPKLTEARNYFNEGQYWKAQDSLDEYINATGYTDRNLADKIKEAKALWTQGKSAYDAKNYDTAKFQLNKLLELNPNDDEAKAVLNNITKIENERRQNQYFGYYNSGSSNYRTKSESAWKPTKNRFNLTVESAFAKPAVLGLDMGFNASYFQLDFNFVASFVYVGESGDSGYIYDDEIDDFGVTDDGNFVAVEYMITVAPGVNFKYLSAGLGVGVAFTKELQDSYLTSSGYYKGEIVNGSHFMLRPNVSGYIPFRPSDFYGGGLKLTVGYNIITGISGQNQFMFGIGFFC